AYRLAPGGTRVEPAHQSAGREWRRADLDAISHGAAGATSLNRGHIGAGRRRDCADQIPASPDDLLVQHFPDLVDCHGRACRSGCDLAGSLSGEFPPLASHVELRRTEEASAWSPIELSNNAPIV